MSELRAHFPERDAYLDRLAQHYADGLAVGVGVFGARAYVPPAEEYHPEATPLGDPEMAMYMPVDYGVLEEASYTLHERGLTLVSEFSADTAGVAGVAMSPRAPGDLRTFNKRPERPVVVSEAISGEVPRAVELEQLQEMALRALDESMWVLGEEGVADMLELVFTDRGNPTMKVTVVSPFDGRVLGTAQHDVDGNLMALEENQ